MKKQPFIILAGPTAVGKSQLSIQLAKAVNGEIISADSMQIYKYMDIGTAKIRPDETEGITHYLIDELEPDEEFNVFKFKKMAKRAADTIYAKGKIPILAGGTGFYIQAVLYDIEFAQIKTDNTWRDALELLAKEKGNCFLHEMLKKVDERAAETIHPNNVKRVIRALEYFHQSGEKISEHNEKQRQQKSPYQFCYFVLNNEREILYANINKRVDNMMEQGLVQEVKHLYLERGYNRSLVSMQGLGYKELISYLEEESTLKEAVDAIKKETRHFAKRQLTWFKREADTIWVEKNKFQNAESEILPYLLNELQKRGIIDNVS